MTDETWALIRARFWELCDSAPSRFMVPELDAPQRLWACDGPYGTMILTADDVSEGMTLEFVGIGARIRLSAPGYLDCTEWSPVADVADVEQFFTIFVDEE